VLPKDEEVEELINIFGYRCEFELQNAYDACRSFSQDFTGGKQFFALSEGLSALCEHMADEIKGNGGQIRLRQKVHRVHREKSGLLVTTNGKPSHCDAVVFAIKPHQMRAFAIMRPVQTLLGSVRAGQLLRIYAKFPVRERGPWFAGMKKTTTNSFLRQIIPISEKRGLIMISYTDGSDVNFFLRGKHVRSDAQNVVMAECRRLFGNIPNPVYFKAHYWSEGCHYWKPHADSDLVSERLVNPVPNVFTCGEGFSQNQCWMEGALQSAERMVSRIVL
jgi:monoamine oxidase